MIALILALYFISIFGAALVAGGQILIRMVIVPVKHRWPTGMSVQLHQATLDYLPDRYLKPSCLIAGITALLGSTILLVQHNLSGWSLVWTILGLVGMVGVIITSRYFNVRTNKIIKTWSSDKVPENYPQIRDRWDRIHTIRASFGTLMLISFIIVGLSA